MRAPRGLMVLTGLNVILLVVLLVQQLRPAFAESEPPVLRGSGLQIVDSQGRVRASIGVMPAGKSPNGEEYAETVLLRLITEKGRPTIKIAATEPASGMSITGPTGTQSTYAILEARGTATSFKLRNENGGEQVVSP
jgi:hypothetical protein